MRASRGMGAINPKKMKAGGSVFKSHTAGKPRRVAALKSKGKK